MNIKLRRWHSALFPLIFLIGMQSVALQAQSLKYPEARRTDHVDHYHGKTVSDPYHWLEDMDDLDVLQWVHAQDDLLADYVAAEPKRAGLETRLRQMQEYENIWFPARGGDFYFMLVFPVGERSPLIRYRKGLDGPTMTLINSGEKFDPDENPLRRFFPSPDGKYLALLEGIGQSRWRRVKIYDVQRGELLDDTIRGIYSGNGGLSWTRDGQGFYYTRYEEPSRDQIMNTTVSDSRIYYHRVGSSQAKDWLIFETPDKPDWLYWPLVTFDNRYLIITEGGRPNSAVFYKDISKPDSKVVPLIDAEDANFSFEGNVETVFRFKTTLDAPNGRIIEFDIRNGGLANYREVVAEDEEAVLSIVGEVGGRLVLQYTKHAVPEVRVHSLSGDKLYDADLPSIGLIGGFTDDPEQSTTLYRFNNLFDPGSTYSMNVHTGKSTLFSRPELAFNPDDFELNQVFYRSKDGTRVPMFIAHRKGMRKSVDNHVFLYGYGAYKWTAFPWFQPQVLAWMELGGIYAMPGLRGGGEYGESWYEAGRKLNKPNTITDYISAAEYLIDEGYTSKGNVVANGGSASSVVAGTAFIQRPELFGAAVIDVPLFDMLRYQLFGSGGNWGPEFGLSDNAEEFETLISYSPYHNVQDGFCYPPILTTVGNLDDTTAPMHGYKFTAAVQYAQGCDNPVMLKVMWGAGHAVNLGNSPEQRASTGADQIAFLIRTLGIGSD